MRAVLPLSSLSPLCLARVSVNHSCTMSQSSQSRRSSQALQHDSMLRHSLSNRYRNPDIFSDDYSLEQADSSTSGGVHRREPSLISVGSSLTAYSSHERDSTTGRFGNRDSTENPFGDAARVSFDGSNGIRRATHGTNCDSLTSSVNTTPSITQRSQSSSSRISLPPRALSPYRGTTGPSHPYAMYPQVGRSPSVTTTSSIRLPESSAPQHPYAMYPQNVVVEEGMDDRVIPIGFPGHLPTYPQIPPPSHRADDDIADIVGPDGHTEPLPPYSRFPIGLLSPSEERLNLSGNVIAEEDHSNDLMGPPTSGMSSRSLVANAGNARGTTSPSAPAPAGGAPPSAGGSSGTVVNEKVSRSGPRRTCFGLPIWTVVLIAMVMVICAVVGGVIGGVLGANTNKGKSAPQPGSTTTAAVVTVTATTPGMDAMPTPAAPTNMPNGQFAVSPVTHNMSRFCVSDPTFKYSWDCLSDTSMMVQVDGTGNHRTATFGNQSSSSSSGSSYTYGAQIPTFNPVTKRLRTVLDTNDLGLGPALFFYDVIDKLVIVHEQVFPAGGASQSSPAKKRDYGSDSPVATTLRPGDRPWYCWWNSTIMEFYMYLDTDLGGNGTSSAMSTWNGSQETASSADQMSASVYPRMVKMEEKRNYPGAKSPYCQQMQVGADGDVAPFPSSSTVNIEEAEPMPSPTMVSSDGADPMRIAKTDYGSNCYCVSLSQG